LKEGALLHPDGAAPTRNSVQVVHPSVLTMKKI